MTGQRLKSGKLSHKFYAKTRKQSSASIRSKSRIEHQSVVFYRRFNNISIIVPSVLREEKKTPNFLYKKSNVIGKRELYQEIDSDKNRNVSAL